MFNYNLMFLENQEKGSDRSDQEMPEHKKLSGRLQKTLYYGRYPKADRPSLPLTDLAVEHFRDACPRKLGRVNMYRAADITRNACVSPCGLMLSMIYLKRLKGRKTEYLTKVSSSDAFLISMMVASKYLYDEGSDEEVFNDEWAESGNMDLDELNEQEGQFLSAIDWNLFVHNAEFQNLMDSCEKRIALSQGLDRGWFSYMDMTVLQDSKAYTDLIKMVTTELAKIVLVCSVAYVASVLTILCSTVIITSVMKTPSSIHVLPQTHPITTTEEKQHPTCNETDIEGYQRTSQKSQQQTQQTFVSNLMTLTLLTETINYGTRFVEQLWSTAVNVYAKTVKSQQTTGAGLLNGFSSSKQDYTDEIPRSTLNVCAKGCCPSQTPKHCSNVTIEACKECNTNSHHQPSGERHDGLECDCDCSQKYCCCYQGDPIRIPIVFNSMTNINLGFSTSVYPHFLTS